MKTDEHVEISKHLKLIGLQNRMLEQASQRAHTTERPKYTNKWIFLCGACLYSYTRHTEARKLKMINKRATNSSENIYFHVYTYAVYGY